MKPAPTEFELGNNSRRGGFLVKGGVALAVAAAVALTVFGVTKSDTTSFKGASVDYGEPLQWRVQRRDLTISSITPGELKTKNTTPVRSAVKTYRQLKITWIIPEGTQVKKGDKLVELDSSELQESYLHQKIKLADGQQAAAKAETAHAIASRQYETNLIMVKNKLDMAKIDLEKYTQSDFLQEKREKETAIILAEEELKLGENKLEWTRKLYAREFETKQALDADTLAVRKNVIALEKATEDLKALKEFTYRKMKTQYETAVVEADGLYEEIVLTGERDIESKKAAWDSATQRVELETLETANLKEQVEQTVLKAPEDGLVVYHKERYMMNAAPLKVGTIVNSRQILIDLPDFSSWIVEARVHESMIQQIRVGQKAFIILEPFPEELFEGTVSTIGVLPDESNWYRETQEYVVKIDVDDGDQPNFKPGMSAKVEIVIDELQDVLTVPNQAVDLVDGKPIVRVVGDNNVVTVQKIEVGRSNDQFVEILSGVEEGQQVALEQTSVTDSGLGAHPTDKATAEQRREAAEAAEEAKAPGDAKTETGKGPPLAVEATPPPVPD